ncbi:MAG: DUF1294 domain-containing protein [Clostridia bacterium]|nr:DUF1294 domain-containing protein [Clostridia bacterium]
MMDLLYVLLIWNSIVFILFGADKYKAKRGHWRIPEKFLLGCAFLFGSVGAFLGMKVFRHKTRHNKFRIGIPLMLLVHLLLLLYLTFYI